MAKRAPVLAPDVARVLDGWCPVGWTDDDLRLLESFRGTVKDWVVKAAPKNPHVARRLLRTTALLTLWAQQTLGTTDARTVLDPAKRRALGDESQFPPVAGLA